MALITNIRHFLTEDGKFPSNLPLPARKLAEYLGEIISAGSFAAPGIECTSMVSCRRRPGRKSCKGKIVVYRQNDNSEIHWRCPVCEGNGVISNWQGTMWDLSNKTTIR